MKRLFAFVFIYILIITMTSCSSKSSNTDDAITIYMLTENEDLVNVINTFEKINPKVKINFEFGIKDTFKTPSEAKKELNTRLLAGEGPDVIIMDDLETKGYLKSGRLADITSVVNENHDGILSNIKDNYLIDDKCYYIPLAISLIADSNALGKSLNFLPLNEFVETITKENLNITGMSYDNLSAIIYRTEVEPYFRKNNAIDRKYLETFYLLLNDLMNCYNGEITFASYEQTNLKVSRLRQFMRVIYGETDISMDYINTIFDAQCLYSLEEEEKIEFQFKKADKSYYYIPQGMVSINAKSKNKKNAEELIQYLLSEEGQATLLDQEYIPINKNVLKKGLKQSSQYNINGEVTIHPWSQHNKNAFINVVENANTPLMTDSHLMEIIMGGAMVYLNKESSLEETINNTLNKLELYMKE